jgi:hypothetical protein
MAANPPIELERREHDGSVDMTGVVTGGVRTSATSEKTLTKQATADGGQENQHGYLSGMKLLAVLVAMVIPYFLVMLDAAINSTAAPQITSDFDSLLDVGWYGAAYQVTSSASQPLSGKVYTKFNLKACL